MGYGERQDINIPDAEPGTYLGHADMVRMKLSQERPHGGSCPAVGIYGYFMSSRKDSSPADMIVMLMSNEDSRNRPDGLANLLQGFFDTLSADSGIYEDGSATG